MGEWKVYKIYLFWRSDWMYLVGRKIDETGPLENSNIEWEGFYSSDQDECIRFAKELNRRQNGQTE